MHCRTCGKAVVESAVVCIGCGSPPLAGTAFCQACGASTNPNASVCVKCGVGLKNQSSASGGTGPAVFLGLNQSGVIAFIVLLLVCLPLAWLPWVIKSCKAA